MPYHILDSEYGYSGDYCQPCRQGKHGRMCRESCSEHCKPSRVCNIRDGTCTCEKGYRPKTCKYGELSKNQ